MKPELFNLWKKNLKANKKYELTLLTCNNSNQKRIIVKAYMKEY